MVSTNKVPHLNHRYSLWMAVVLQAVSAAEIASFRSVSEGTVKAQTNAIYRKAGVSGRAQLVSLFVDELVADDHAPPA